MNLRYLILSLFLLPLLAWTQSPADSLRAQLETIAEESGLPGFGVAITSPDQIVFQAGFGMADLAQGQSYTEQSTQNIGSVSKTFIGLAVMKAVEMGKLSLEDPINQHLPFQLHNPHFPDQAIKVWHLVTHTSSILDRAYYEASYVLNDPQQIDLATIPKKERKDYKRTLKHTDMSMEQYFRAVLLPDGKWYKKKNYLAIQPGGRYIYSNIAAALAAFVVEQATKVPFPEFCQQHIFTPLDMNDTGWQVKDIDLNHHASNHFLDGSTIPAYHLITYPDGGLLTSARDMAKYVQEMVLGFKGKGRLLEKENYETLFRKLLPKQAKPSTFPPEESTAVFWHYEKDFVGHSGGDPGIISVLRIFPEENMGYYLMANVSAEEKESMMNQFISAWKLLKKYGPRIAADTSRPD
ncbi:MAG: serine hydrolase domain-containing protein [Bacteroidota bacterium]